MTLLVNRPRIAPEGRPVDYVRGNRGAGARQLESAATRWRPWASNTGSGRCCASGASGGGVGTAPEGYGGHVTFYVEVPDVEAALAKAESLGGSRMMGPDEVPEAGITIGLFTDPEGHVVGLVK